MGEYWYFLHADSAPPNHRLYVMVDRFMRSNERIELKDCLGYTERMYDGRWLCFVKVGRRAKCIGYEPSRKEGQRRVSTYYRGWMEREATR